MVRITMLHWMMRSHEKRERTSESEPGRSSVSAVVIGQSSAFLKRGRRGSQSFQTARPSFKSAFELDYLWTTQRRFPLVDERLAISSIGDFRIEVEEDDVVLTDRVDDLLQMM